MDEFGVAFYRQRDTARRRGIPFTLTLEEWKTIWIESGLWDQRGRGRGKYCMMRNNDAGGYCPGNVTIGLHEANVTESNRRQQGRIYNYPKTTLPPLERLYMKVQKNAETGCHLWSGNAINGYGQTVYQGKKILTHRLSYTLQKGEIPDGMIVCHSCDNPSCINPEHLFLGTAKTNAEDKVRKGRQSRVGGGKGERHASAKLTEKQILEIRADTRMQTIIAAVYGITKSTVCGIKARRIWRHI